MLKIIKSKQLNIAIQDKENKVAILLTVVINWMLLTLDNNTVLGLTHK